MARHARGLSGELRGKIDTAAEAGRASLALVALLAVGREGLETALFLWAATQAATGSDGSTTAPLLGALLGILTAVAMGFVFYKGVLKINLSKFFTLDRRHPDRRRRRRPRLRRARPAGGRHPARPEQPRLRRQRTRSRPPRCSAPCSRAPSTSPPPPPGSRPSPGWLYLVPTMTLFLLPRPHRRAQPAAARGAAARPSAPTSPTERHHPVKPPDLAAACALAPSSPTSRLQPDRVQRPRLRAGQQRHDHRPVLGRRVRADHRQGAARATSSFKVKNTGNKVTEFYLYAEDGLRIVGEIENVGPGLSRDLVLSARARQATSTACKPGHDRQGHPRGLHGHRLRQGHRDQGCRPGRPSTRRPSQYAAYVKDQAGQLVDRDRGVRQPPTRPARTTRPARCSPDARGYWERIETVAESFGDLDPKMDLREADLEPGQEWTGWHRIEKDLWPPATRLPAMTPGRAREVRRRPAGQHQDPRQPGADLDYTVDQIGNGSKGLLDEVATGKITGEEDIWSHTDLYDFQANVDGARVAFEGLEAAARGQGRRARDQIDDRVRRPAEAARQVPGPAGRLRLLRHGHRGPAQAALRRRQRAGRAAVEDDRSHHPVTEPDPSRRPGRRGSSRADGSSESPVPARSRRVPPASAASPTARAGDGDPAAPGVDRASLPLPGRAPGRHHHPGPGPAALRRRSTSPPTPARSWSRCCEAWTEAAARDDRRAGRSAAACPRRTTPRRPTPARRSAWTPSGLTLTFGFGPTLFEKDGKDRFGLARPATQALRELPHFPADNLDPDAQRRRPVRPGLRPRPAGRRARDPQPGADRLRHRRRCAGPSSASAAPRRPRPSRHTPRNLFGFKDGTANLKAEDPAELEKFVWVGQDDDAGADWLAGGSYLVARRINMHIEPWDRTSLREQETLIGRDRAEGAPLSGGTEFTEPDFDAAGPRRPADRRSTPTSGWPTRRRTRAPRCCAAATTSPTAATPSAASTPACSSSPSCATPTSTTSRCRPGSPRQDGLMEYLQHTGSGLFAVPPGVRSRNGCIGEALFA